MLKLMLQYGQTEETGQTVYIIKWPIASTNLQYTQSIKVCKCNVKKTKRSGGMEGTPNTEQLTGINRNPELFIGSARMTQEHILH